MELGFPCGLAGKESSCNAEDLGLIPGLGRSPGEGKGYPLHYSGLENSMDCTVNGVTKSGHDRETFTLWDKPICLGYPVGKGNCWTLPQTGSLGN